MKELLLKWVELEQDQRCRLNEGSLEFRIDEDAVFNFWPEDYPMGFPAYYRALVQLAIQEAIAAKGWTFSLISDEGLNYPLYFDAAVFAHHREVTATSYNSSAEALLIAYLHALEKELEDSLEGGEEAA